MINLKASTSVMALMALTSAAAFSQDVNSFDIEIKAQKLTEALTELSDITQLQLIYSPDQLKGIETGGVSGKLNSLSVLQKLLVNTNLTLQKVDETTYVIRSKSESGEKFQTISYGENYLDNLAVIEDDERMDEMEGSELDEIVVYGKSFNYNLIESANKMPMTIKDTPQSVKIITEDMLDFASITDLNEIYKLDAGGHATHTRPGSVRTYFRGFANGVSNAFKVDGFRVRSETRPDLAAYERLEIVKGAVSTLYGQSSPAGTVNAVTKKPQAEFGGSVSFEAGQWDHYRAEVDIYGSLTEDEKLTFRFVGAYLNEGDHLDFNERENIVIAPSLKYDFSEDTSLLVQINYQKLDFSITPGFPATFDADGPGGADNPDNYQMINVPYSRFGVDTNWSKRKRDIFFIRASLDHHFANDWTLRTNVQYSNVTGVNNMAWIGSYDTISPDPDGTQDVYLYLQDDNSSPSYSAEVNLFGDVELFGRNHTLFFGADYALVQDKYTYTGGVVHGSDTGFNIFNPDFSLLPEPTALADFGPDGLFMPGDVGEVKKLYAREKALGITTQAMLHPTDQLTVILGARFTRNTADAKENCCSYEGYFDPFDTFSEDLVPQQAVVIQAAATYAVTEDINFYASYGETFDPGGSFAFDPSDPEGRGIFLGSNDGVTYETGLKGELFDQQFFWSLAFFYTARINITQQDFDHPQYSVAVGRQRAKGIELDFQGEVLPGWDVYASAVVMNNKYTQGEDAGYTAPFGPKFGLTIYTSYEIQEGSLQGLGFGGGLVHKNRPVFQLFNGMKFPHLFKDFTEVDLRIFYTAEPWHFEVSATNVFDTRYFSPTFSWLGGQIAINPPRRILAKVTRRF